MTVTRAGRIGPYSMILLGVLVAILASLAVVQTRDITASPAGTETSQFEPKIGQLTLEAPPYCTGGICARFNAVISLLTTLKARFPFLARVFDSLIATLVAIQIRLSARFS